MTSPRRDLYVIAGILLILMTIGCEAPADSVGASGGPGSPGAIETVEQAFVDVAAAEKIGESSSEPGIVGETPAGASVDGGFRGGDEVQDPFAAIGPAFSGLGFQTYSSGCDPFEDAYGTCL